MFNRLKQETIKKSPFCAGIDLRLDHVPQSILDKYSKEDELEAMLEYGKLAIDAAADYAACFKFQIACYEAYGIEGLMIYKQLLAYAKAKGCIVIADIKRGDIGSTAELYAKGHFTGDFEADIVTLNAYMGEDAVSPYYPYFKNNNKAAFVLGKTSNPSSVDFQDIKVSNGYVYGEVLDKIKEWGSKVDNDNVISPVGAVVAVNSLSDLEYLKSKIANTFLLIPGYGHQGAKISDIKELISESKNAVINVSRGYTKGHDEASDVYQSLQDRAKQLASELRNCID